MVKELVFVMRNVNEWPLTSAELRLLWDPDVLTIQWTYEESIPSTFMSTRCCWRAGITQIISVKIQNESKGQIWTMFYLLTHETSFSDADILFVFLQQESFS